MSLPNLGAMMRTLSSEIMSENKNRIGISPEISPEILLIVARFRIVPIENKKNSPRIHQIIDHRG